MRSVAQIVFAMVRRLPRGFALGMRGGVFDALLEGPASGVGDAEAAAASVLDELDPRTAEVLLPDFERMLGPDPCGQDAVTLEERRRQAHRRWTARGGQSIPYFISIAATLGVAIEIDEFWPSRPGNLRAGHRLIPEGEQFVWRVRLAETNSWHFRAGRNRAGQALGDFTRSAIECVLRRLKPAHTTIVFSYVLDEGGG
ncbi:YmfQ family protein [Oceaniradius stylonematis]|uniref:YmfQ family protein n=1 Tax=Oceaniradius stylonematis TaxID=2184161 RepID=UPI00273F5C34|nr:putative phage tail protein [Oceaniradius stylonematis]